MPSIDADSKRGIAHEDEVALAGAEPAEGADEVLPCGHVKCSPSPGDQSQVHECLRSDAVVVFAPVRRPSVRAAA